MMPGALAVPGLRTVPLGQLDAFAVEMVDGADMDAVGAHHRHMFPDCAVVMLGHGLSPRCQSLHTRGGGDSMHGRGKPGGMFAGFPPGRRRSIIQHRSEEHTSELQSLMRISYAVLCLKKKNSNSIYTTQASYCKTDHI